MTFLLCVASSASVIDRLASQDCASGPWGQLVCEEILLSPSDELVEETLDSTPLSVWTENPSRTAFHFEANSVGEWLKGSGIDSPIQEAIARHATRHGPLMVFSDFGRLLPTIPNRRKKIELLKGLNRAKSLLVKIRINKDSDVDAIAKYWSRGKRTKDIRPLIESLAQDSRPKTIDVVHLLPPFARRHALTYPSWSQKNMQGHRDCFWTALNFFKEVADDRFAVSALTVEELSKNFRVITDAPRLGDILVYENEKKEAFHAAVYIASDIVFTKNGSSVMAPWVYTSLQSMAHFYPDRHLKTIKVFRHKDS